MQRRARAQQPPWFCANKFLFFLKEVNKNVTYISGGAYQSSPAGQVAGESRCNANRQHVGVLRGLSCSWRGERRMADTAANCREVTATRKYFKINHSPDFFYFLFYVVVFLQVPFKKCVGSCIDHSNIKLFGY